MTQHDGGGATKSRELKVETVDVAPFYKTREIKYTILQHHWKQTTTERQTTTTATKKQGKMNKKNMNYNVAA